MDEAHALAQSGAPAGTLVLARHQLAGRGRGGRRWQAAPDAGFWGTFIERPRDAEMLSVLALRVGLALADALAPLVDGPIGLKWPNDLLVNGGKLAGILIEARWRDGQPEWVAIGIGVNRLVPDTLDAPTAWPLATVRAGVTLEAMLTAIVAPVRAAAAGSGLLTAAECDRWAARDAARGRRTTLPVAGIVEGINASGSVLIRTPDGLVQSVQSGSLQLESPG
jgi:BirA family biotin operon repressor/biotin-[acetyl-CoA-carboxylase] ligase